MASSRSRFAAASSRSRLAKCAVRAVSSSRALATAVAETESSRSRSSSFSRVSACTLSRRSSCSASASASRHRASMSPALVDALAAAAAPAATSPSPSPAVGDMSRFIISCISNCSSSVMVLSLGSSIGSTDSTASSSSGSPIGGAGLLCGEIIPPRRRAHAARQPGRLVVLGTRAWPPCAPRATPRAREQRAPLSDRSQNRLVTLFGACLPSITHLSGNLISQCCAPPSSCWACAARRRSRDGAPRSCPRGQPRCDRRSGEPRCPGRCR